jgi:hypothetical protein
LRMDRSPLRRTSALGQKRTIERASGMSASPPREDMLSVAIEVG